MVNLSAVVALRAVEAPDRTAVWLDDEAWTWSELDRRVNAVARALGELGAGRGDRVGLFLVNGLPLVSVLLGAWRVGVVPVAVSSLYQPDELAKSLDQTTPRFVLTDQDIPALRAALPSDVGELLRHVNELLRDGGEPLRDVGEQSRDGGEPQRDVGEQLRDVGKRLGPAAPVQMADDEEGVIVFTGGTTGLPKPVAMTQAGVMRSLEQLATVTKGGGEGEKTKGNWPLTLAPSHVPPNIVALPLFHSGGQHAFLFALHTGRAVVLMERFSAKELVRLARRHEVDNLFLLPTMLYDLAHLDGTADLAGVRAVLVAGQPLSQTLKSDFESRYRVPILMNYGSTEIGHVAGWSGRDVRDGRWKPGSVGRVYDGVDVEIRDDAGRPVRAGEPGEIFVRARLVRGYVGDEAGTRDLINDGWVRSGDMGYLDPDRVLFLVGRKREMIKTGGFQVWPLEIEEVLRGHPAVADAAVVGIPDDRLGEVPKAFIVPVDPVADQAAQAELTAAILAYAREKLAHFKSPRAVDVVAELPRTAAGKIQKTSLTAAEKGVT